MKIKLLAIAAGAAVLLLLAMAWLPLYGFVLNGGPARTVSSFGGFPLFGFPGVYFLLGAFSAVVFGVIAQDRIDEDRRNLRLCMIGPAIFALLSLHRPDGGLFDILFRIAGGATWFLAMVGGAVLFLSPFLAPVLEGKQPPKAKLPEGSPYAGRHAAPAPKPATPQALPKPQARPAAALPGPDNRKRLS